MSKRVNKSAAECIAFRLGWDIRDVSENRYQYGRTKYPEYTIGDEYFCCPPAGAAPSKERAWVKDGEAYGRQIYSAKAIGGAA